MKRQKIGVLMGGLSAERAVSIETGQSVLAALQNRGFNAEAVFVDRDVDLALRQNEIDIAFLALHGRYGEDGCIQGLLETMGIPYTGSDVLASALAMNKVKAKQMFQLHNLPTPSYYVLPAQSASDVAAAHGDFGFPVVVKPIGEGSSVGVEIVRSLDELRNAVDAALCFDADLLVERFIEGREVSVAVLGDRAIGAVEIAPKSGFYDFSAKYTAGQSEYFIPPRISPARYRGILNQGLRSHRALGCTGATRVDMILSADGNENILEVNTLPGMTPTSLLPKIAHAAGVEFEELVCAILAGATLGHAGRGNGDRRVVAKSFSGDDRRIAHEVGRH